jgi:hypothetical protein
MRDGAKAAVNNGREKGAVWVFGGVSREARESA